MSQPLALVIDDEPDICELLTLTLNDVHGQVIPDSIVAANAVIYNRLLAMLHTTQKAA